MRRGCHPCLSRWWAAAALLTADLSGLQTAAAQGLSGAAIVGLVSGQDGQPSWMLMLDGPVLGFAVPTASPAATPSGASNGSRQSFLLSRTPVTISTAPAP